MELELTMRDCVKHHKFSLDDMRIHAQCSIAANIEDCVYYRVTPPPGGSGGSLRRTCGRAGELPKVFVTLSAHIGIGGSRRVFRHGGLHGIRLFECRRKLQPLM